MRRVGPLVALVVLAAAWTFVFLLVFTGGPVMSGLRVPDGLADSEAVNAAADAARGAFYRDYFLTSALPRVMPVYVVGLVLIVGSVLLVRRAMARRRSR